MSNQCAPCVHAPCMHGKGVRMRGQRGQHGRRTCWWATLALLVSVALVTPTGAEVLLTGAGATFPSALYTQWFTQYATVDGGVPIDYQAIGSGGGIKRLMEQTVAFGASDVPMTDAQIQAAKGGKFCTSPPCWERLCLSTTCRKAPAG